MFSGIVEQLGQITRMEKSYTGAKIAVSLQAAQTETWASIGDSVAVNGCCLTVTEVPSSNEVEFFVSSESLRLTNLAELAQSDAVNLERALPANGRFAGHIVQGHVDATGKISEIQKVGDSWRVWLQIPQVLMKYCCVKGSVTVNGVSLTINEIKDNHIRVQVIPHTWNITNLSKLLPNSAVNIEVDILAKYLERLCNTV